jgi:ion channel-forming bestrophin family protein
VKHYLRGEEGIYYEDLWPLVKFLPAYALPNALPSSPGPQGFSDTDEKQGSPPSDTRLSTSTSASASQLPLHNTSPHKRPPNISVPPPSPIAVAHEPPRASLAPPVTARTSNRPLEEPPLLPSRLPPQFSFFDVFPFSLLVKLLTTRGKEVKGRKAARLRARMPRGKRGTIVSHNVPLEITLYLVRHQEARTAFNIDDTIPTELVHCCLTASESHRCAYDQCVSIMDRTTCIYSLQIC